MADRDIPEFRHVGRPPEDPMNKLSQNIRALVTPRVYDRFDALMAQTGLDQSNAVRLAVYEALERRGLLEGLPENDNTFKEIKEAGLA